ncbi:VanZ family protein [Robertmurraya kyonggiensis]|uniref:VanZ family protein n=1 Tax=Robertmurraya kyonggiensis TaxID=1037680 RepID=A0A4U1DDF9_9BACI|nr:VanZ family protein [Robertmurraya kyonggiensis]TKC19617.1 VanZ family protein [Robertmurraya kyonggiensis]
MDKKIETYIDKIVKQLNCDEQEKREITDEMRDHLQLLKNEYIDQGLTKQEATQKALESFGEQKQLARGLQESLFPFYKVFKIVTWILFGLYSFIILFKLLFQRVIIRILDYARLGDLEYNRYFFIPSDSNGFFDLQVWQLNSNIIPFQNTMNYINGTNTPYLSNIIDNTLGNILIFLPLGILLPILFRKYRSLSKVFIGSTIISFSIEILQFISQLGQFDIDDIILNVIGSTVGYLFIKTIISSRGLLKGSKFRKITN